MWILLRKLSYNLFRIEFHEILALLVLFAKQNLVQIDAIFRLHLATAQEEVEYSCLPMLVLALLNCFAHGVVNLRLDRIYENVRILSGEVEPFEESGSDPLCSADDLRNVVPRWSYGRDCCVI